MHYDLGLDIWTKIINNNEQGVTSHTWTLFFQWDSGKQNDSHMLNAVTLDLTAPTVLWY